MKKKNIIFLLIIFLLIFSLVLYLKYSKEESISKIEKEISEEPYKSNIMEDVSYSSKDAKGNEYIVNASQGEIDYDRPNIIYLTNVRAFIKLTNSNDVMITSSCFKPLDKMLIKIKISMSNPISPLAIVKTLYGNGVKPAKKRIPSHA